MIGIFTWEVRADRTTLKVLSGTISIDDQNVPAITADIVVPYDAEVLPYLDPRQLMPPRITLQGTLTQWSSLPISDLTAYVDANAATMADLSTIWAGQTIGDISAMFGAPLHEDAPTTGETMSLDLHVREVAYDDWEMRISLASDEALLTDWAPTDYDRDVVPLLEAQAGLDPDRVLTYVDPVLTAVTGRGVDPNAYSSTDLVTPPGDLFNWSSYETAWNMIRAALDDANLKLRVNPDGIGFSMLPPENPVTANTWSFTTENVISAKHAYSRTGDWYDSSILTKEGETSFGYPTGAHTRTYREEMPDGINPSQSMAQNIVTRSRNRGQFIDIVAPIRPGVFMRDEFTYEPTEERTWIDLSADGSRATTPDTAALSITGDIDITWWGRRETWSAPGTDLISKWSATGNQRSWLVRAEADRTLTLFWSNDGTTIREARSLAALPAPLLGTVGVRVTLDVNNGAAGRTTRFYYSVGDGEWIQLGGDVITAGTTSIYNSTAALTVGREPTSVAFDTPQRVYGWELKTGGGAVRSGARMDDLAVGLTSFTDDQGNTWTVTGGETTRSAEAEDWQAKAVTYDLSAATMSIRGEQRY